jgi:ParB family chromosome partitioning protein
MNALHSKATPEWYTPVEYVEAARRVMGGIDLDPASCALANLTVKAARFFTKDDDGLAQAWSGRVFLNPPGGLVREFWRKLIAESVSGVNEAVWIGYSLQQLQTLQTADTFGPLEMANTFCVPRRRIAFIDATGKPSKSPTHANYIAYFGPRSIEFMLAFRQFGEVR